MHRDVNVRARLLIAFALVTVLVVPAAGFADDDADAKDAPHAGEVSVAEITAGSARVTATLQLGKGAAAYWFEYWRSGGPVSSGPAATATHEEDDKDHRVVVARTLSGLSSDTTYSVRLVASSSKGRSVGPATAFTTASGPASTAPGPATPAAEAPQEGAPQPPAGPVLGTSFVAQAEEGSVRVRLPGSDRFVDLPQAASVPVGTVVDARRGAITLSTALPDGGIQQGTFGGGRFQVRQERHDDGMTDLHLRGGSLASCRASRRRGERSVAAVATRKKPRAKRRMWGRDRSGRFRTFGRDSVTTVRGTAWSVADRCDGTVTRVTEGAVDVRVRRSGRVVRVAAGERFLARHRR
jgi:hypothetical protein